MALISDLIKKYDAEGKQRIEEARRMNSGVAPVGSREDIFLKVEAPPLRALKEQNTTSLKSSIWSAKPLPVDPQKGITPELQEEININQAAGLYQSSGRTVQELEAEVERLRAENSELRRKMGEVEVERV